MRYFSAMRHASIAASKQSDGDIAATTGTGDSRVAAEQHHQQVALLRLRRHPGRRAGALDVADHERQLELIARPIVSAFSTMPGPADVVTPSEPPNDAPTAAPAAAISSSAWNVRTPKCL